MSLEAHNNRAMAAGQAAWDRREPDDDREVSQDEALELIEAYLALQRSSLIEARARNLADAAEHDAQCLAELQAELNGEVRTRYASQEGDSL